MPRILLSKLIVLVLFKEEPLSLFKIPMAASLNSMQCTVSIDDVSWLLTPISAV